LLFVHSAEINHRDVVGNRPLHQASFQAWRGDSKMVQFLIEEGKADMNLLSNSGCNPLYCAVEADNTQVAMCMSSNESGTKFEFS